MQVDTADSISYSGPSGSTEKGWVLCAQCGDTMEPNNAGICVACLRNTVDITESVPKQATVNYCKGCNRYLSPPATWLLADLESRELLAICLRKLKGLKEVRLVDAGFVWTEPHSKRLRIKLTVQKEVLSSTILQQVFEVEFIVQYAQCPECTRLAAKNTWRAMVQVRQKVDHKRTFLYLEQLILKHGADKDTLEIKERKDGLDFSYSSRQHAQKMVDFLVATTPVRIKTSEQLISSDVHTSTSNYKSTFSVELVPICKDDLICLPKRLAQSMSNIGQLVLCQRVGNSLHFVDPTTLQHAEVTSPAYWRAPFTSLASASSATTEFMVLDIEPTSHPPKTSNKGRFMLADAQVTPANSSMDADMIFHCRTHMGAILKPGDTVMGYLLTHTNFNDPNWEALNQSNQASTVPEVVLVRKTYPERRKKSKGRNWRLKSMVKQSTEGEGEMSGLGRQKGLSKAQQNLEQQKAEADYERFLQDLEEDDEMRQAVNLYKTKPKPGAMDVEESDVDEEEDEGGMPQISMDELLDDVENMTLDADDADGVL